MIEIEEFDKLISEIKGEKEMKLLFEVWREDGVQIGLKRGLEKGQKRQNENIVINSLKQNLDIKTISLITGLTMEEIEELKNKCKVL
jgi:predicted transposase YdaD